jgi:hypothetical protein
LRKLKLGINSSVKRRSLIMLANVNMLPIVEWLKCMHENELRQQG